MTSRELTRAVWDAVAPRRRRRARWGWALGLLGAAIVLAALAALLLLGAPL